MVMCPYDGFTYIGHGGGPRPLLVVAPSETVVVLLEVLPQWFPPLSLFLLPLLLLWRLLFLCQLLLSLLLLGPLSLFLPGRRGDAKGGDSGADNILLE
jgi:hypothetical protein